VDRIRDAAETFADFMGSYNPSDMVSKLDKTQNKIRELMDYFQSLIPEYSQKNEVTFFTQLKKFQVEGKEIWTDEHIADHLITFFFAGFETTCNMIGNSFVALIQNPSIRQQLKQNPNLTSTFFDEVIRFYSPASRLSRIVVKDFQLENGARLEKGEGLVLELSKANRDPSKFENPNVFDITRKNLKEHLGFGTGPHLCVGKVLARLEVTTLINSFLKRFPNFECTVDPNTIQRIANPLVNGFTSVPIKLNYSS